MTEYTFWLVWCEGGNSSTFMHTVKHGAVTEAERLARANPGKRFVVMQAMEARMVDGMQKVEYDPIPF